MKTERTIRITLAPLVPESEIVSAIVARLVRECEDASQWETLSDEVVTVCAKWNMGAAV